MEIELLGKDKFAPTNPETLTAEGCKSFILEPFSQSHEERAPTTRRVIYKICCDPEHLRKGGGVIDPEYAAEEFEVDDEVIQEIKNDNRNDKDMDVVWVASLI